MKCIKCKEGILSEQKYEGVLIDKCDNCEGVWLDEKEIVDIINDRGVKFSPELIIDTITKAFAGLNGEHEITKLKCLRCDEALRAFNFDYSSGIILDRCPKDHGIWFDKTELEKIQIHKEHWEDEVHKRKNQFSSAIDATEENYKLKNSEYKITFRENISNFIISLIGNDE